jgi:hypothetical protein
MCSDTPLGVFNDLFNIQKAFLTKVTEKEPKAPVKVVVNLN